MIGLMCWTVKQRHLCPGEAVASCMAWSLTCYGVLWMAFSSVSLCPPNYSQIQQAQGCARTYHVLPCMHQFTSCTDLQLTCSVALCMTPLAFCMHLRTGLRNVVFLCSRAQKRQRQCSVIQWNKVYVGQDNNISSYIVCHVSLLMAS